jgi:hypothetical protein
VVRPGTVPAGAGDEAAVTATSVPPLSDSPGSHGSEATHDFTIADSVGGDLPVGARPMLVPRGPHTSARSGSQCSASF